MTKSTVEIRPFASNLIEQDCEACGEDATFAVSYSGKRFKETEYGCDAHVGPIAGNVAKRQAAK